MNASNLPAYSVTVKKANGYAEQKTVRLQISVGQNYHEGDKFAATLHWARTRFDKVIICLNDTLQRYNHCFEKGLPDSLALKITQKQGDEWLARNMHVIKMLPNFEIHRWEDWRNQPDYLNYLEDVKCIYCNNPDVQAAYDAAVQETWDRRSKVTQDSRQTSFLHHSTEYLLEETAVFLAMFKQEDAADVYPGTISIPFKILQERSNETLPKSVAEKTFTRIDFRRRKSDQVAA